MSNEPLEIPPNVYSQLEALRDLGTHNMLTEVKDGLRQLEFDEALEWLEDNWEVYFQHAMRGGFKPKEE